MAIFTGRGVVWDKERNKELCRFVNGTFETKEERTKDILNSLKYPCDMNDEIVIIEDDDIEAEGNNVIIFDDEDSFGEFKSYCKEKGYKGYGNIKTAEKMKEFIEKREGE